LPDLKIEQLLLIAGFILPGALSMYVYGLKVPQKEFDLKDRIGEAICFSLINFMIVWLPIHQAFAAGIPPNLFVTWVVLIIGFVVAPVFWPFLLVWLLQRAEEHGWIAVRAKTAWDDFFGKQDTECWLQVELADGRVIGGDGSAGNRSQAPGPTRGIFISKRFGGSTTIDTSSSLCLAFPACYFARWTTSWFGRTAERP
jgi:Family of unknown function (DUF6338)